MCSYKLAGISIILLFSVQLANAQKTAFRFSYSGTSSKVVVPRLFSDVFDEAGSGGGNDLSLGFVFGAHKKVSFGVGYRKWKWPFSFTANGTYNNEDVKATESGHLHYSGTYLRIDRNLKHFFFTGGFDISFANKYKNSLVVKDLTGDILVRENNRTKSILTEKFNNQFNLVLGLGPILNVGKKTLLKGDISFVVPFSPIYDTGVKVPQVYLNGSSAPDAKVDFDFFPVFKFGFAIEHRFGNE